MTSSAETIDPNRVEAILSEVLAEAPATDGGNIVRGVLHDYVIDRAKLAPYRGEVVEILSALADEFMDNGGGGWSFLNLCQTSTGELWTGLHLRCEQLIVLADALGLASYPLPREMWSALPGSLPYVAFKRSAFAQSEAA